MRDAADEFPVNAGPRRHVPPPSLAISGKTRKTQPEDSPSNPPPIDAAKEDEFDERWIRQLRETKQFAERRPHLLQKRSGTGHRFPDLPPVRRMDLTPITWLQHVSHVKADHLQLHRE